MVVGLVMVVVVVVVEAEEEEQWTRKERASCYFHLGGLDYYFSPVIFGD